MPDFAPAKELLDAYKKHNGDWSVYEKEVLDLMARADIFDYIERFHNPRRRSQMESLEAKDLLLVQPSVEME